MLGGKRGCEGGGETERKRETGRQRERDGDFGVLLPVLGNVRGLRRRLLCLCAVETFELDGSEWEEEELDR